MQLEAVSHVRRMRGGAQSHLMRCTDGYDYVVKFLNNPQHPRVLLNEWLGTRLAGMIGLPVAEVAVVHVGEELVAHAPDLVVEIGGLRKKLTSGLCLGSRYVVSPFDGQAYDYLPENMMNRVRNVGEFAGALAFDKWTCNADGRQAVFWKRNRERKFTATFIDQGYCFNAGEWNFQDAPLRGVFGRNDVYSCVTSWESFEPWLSRIEHFPESSLWPLLQEVPPEWYGAIEEVGGLLSRLLVRRSRVRGLVLDFKNSSRNPFPNWHGVSGPMEIYQVRGHAPRNRPPKGRVTGRTRIVPAAAAPP